MVAKSSTPRLAFPCLEAKDVGDAGHEAEEIRETRRAEGAAKRRSDQSPASDIDQVARAAPGLAVMAKFAALAMIGLGFAVLFGWLFGIEPLKRVLPGLATMKPTTAATFILSGILLFLSRPGIRSASNRRLRGALSLLIIAVAILTLTGFAFLGDFDIAHVPIASGWGEATKPMSVVTALEFALFGAAMFVPHRSPAQDLAFVAVTSLGILISLLVFTGYLYNLPILYSPIANSSIAIHTAVAFFVLFVGAAMTRPNKGWVTLLAPELGDRRVRAVALARSCCTAHRARLGAQSGNYRLHYHERVGRRPICPVERPFPYHSGMADRRDRQSTGPEPGTAR